MVWIQDVMHMNLGWYLELGTVFELSGFTVVLFGGDR